MRNKKLFKITKMNDNIKRTWKNLIHKIEVNLHTNLHFQFVYYLVLGLKISSHASRAQNTSFPILKEANYFVRNNTLNKVVV